MAFLRSVLHMMWMLVTVIPWGIIMCVASIWRRGEPLYWMAERWLGWAIAGARIILGIRARVTGMENLPQEKRAGAVLLVKHQSTLETFLMPTLMPHPLAYVFKKELIYVPFFGWAMARLDMIHIDRSQRAQAFNKVVKQGRELLAQGIWIIMFPEGTRIPRGQQGTYKSGGTRLAVETGAPVIPIAVIGTDVVAPPGKIFGTYTRPGVRFGKPLDFSRYEGMEDDRFVLRSITDEIMYEIMELSGQEYVDVYAAKAKELAAQEAKEAKDAKKS
jgi:1-acyl-sn-glycerol-3-phosphate acyltransferase